MPLALSPRPPTVRLTADQYLLQPPQRLAPFYVIHGAEPLSALEAADAIRQQARADGYLERETLTAEPGFDWTRLLAASGTLSLFASQRLLELRILSGKPGREGSAAIEQFCVRLPEDTVTLVTLPEIEWQGQKSKWFAAFEAAAVMIEARPVERARLPAWIKARMAWQNLTADEAVLESLADRFEGNLLAAKQEIAKLALLCGEREITAADVAHGVANVSRFDVSQVVEAVCTGEPARIQRVLDGLKAEGEALPLILWLLVNELRALAHLTGATDSGRAPHPQKARLLQPLVRRHSAASVKRLFARAAQVDRLIKGIGTRDPWDALVDLACSIAGKPLMRAA
jgi:DNA polymerase III subunit delta